jgi:MarR family transcriptional regulator, organic hydroperoxide resistance regulator
MPKPKHLKTLDFLLANICHLHHSRARQLFKAIGLHRGQPLVLLALWEREGLTQTELAERLEITPATVTKMLQRMEKAGFIQRKPDAGDQRVSRVHLAPAGRAVRRDVESVWKTMQAETFANFTLPEQALLRRFLLQILENLQHATGEPPHK